MTGAADNTTVYEALRAHVAEAFFADVAPPEDIVWGPLQVNCFSLTFWMNVAGEQDRRGAYVKIPKIIMYRKASESIMPLSAADRELAENEYRSLVHLARTWRHDELDVRFVRPIGFVPEYNAIVTERFYAAHFFRLFRRADLRRRLGQNSDTTHVLLARVGEALSRFHRTSLRICLCDVGGILDKIDAYCVRLASCGVAGAFLKNVSRRVGTCRGSDLRTQSATTLKGFEVRQVFVGSDGGVFILDPGKMKDDCHEADLARFIGSCRILYWGGPLFLLGMRPSVSYERAFLRGYYGRDQEHGRVLRLLIIKELLKQWTMAHVVVGVKPWPSALKRIARRIYIDPFYKREVDTDLSAMGR